VNQGDPTDNALAAIASMLDQPEVVGESEKPQSGEKSQSEETPQSEEKPQPEEKPAAPPVVEAHGYSRVGPGPMASLRFKWTVREDHGDYYVDETFGENSSPMVTGPMTGDAAIQLVDDREAEARRRFEHIKAEMAGRSAGADPDRKDGGQA
jgi:hypothetical protein